MGAPTLHRPDEAIERHELMALTPAIVRRLRQSRRPFAVRSRGVQDQDGHWSLPAVQQLMRGQRHAVRQFSPKGHRYMDDVECSFDEFAALVSSGAAAARDMYWADHDQPRRLSRRLARESQLADIERKLGLWVGRRVLSLWAGAAGHVETLHFDSCDNLHLVLHGRKRWLLFPPEALPRLRFVPWAHACRAVFRGENLPVTSSGVGLDPACSLLEPSEVEKCSEPPPLQIELRAGDALYVPAGWAHQVEGLCDDAGGDDQEFVFSLSRFLPTPLRRLAPWLWARPRMPDNGDRWAAFGAVLRIRTFHAWSGFCEGWRRRFNSHNGDQRAPSW